MTRKLAWLGNKGFGLVDSLIGVAILAGIGVGGLYLSNHQSKTVISTRYDLTNAMIILREQLNQPRICSQNLRNQKVNAGITLDKLENGGALVISKGDQIENGRYQLEEIKIGDYRTNSLRTQIVFTFKNNTGAGKPRIQKTLGILTEVVGDQITKCLNALDLSGSALANTLCQDADPSGVGDCDQNFTKLLAQVKQLYCTSNPTQPFLRYDTGTKKCMPLDANKLCAAGSFFRGWKADAQPDCYIRPTTPPPITTACPPKQIIWGNCKANALAGVSPNTQPVTNTVAGYNGTANLLCSGGGWKIQSQVCNPDAFPPTNLSLTHTANTKTFTVSWTAGTGNGGAGGCVIQFFKNNSTWANVGAVQNCDANASNILITLPTNGWDAGTWTNKNVRLLRTSDSTSMGNFSGQLKCSSKTGSATYSPTVDEDCNFAWDNYVGKTLCKFACTYLTVGSSFNAPLTYNCGGKTANYNSIQWMVPNSVRYYGGTCTGTPSLVAPSIVDSSHITPNWGSPDYTTVNSGNVPGYDFNTARNISDASCVDGKNRTGSFTSWTECEIRAYVPAAYF